MVDKHTIKPNFARISIRIHCNGLIVLFQISSPAVATELVNDGWSDGQPALFQDGFISGEIGASRFVPDGPCP